jgi:glycosyltransferase involved in cell wall biosynthesis
MLLVGIHNEIAMKKRILLVAFADLVGEALGKRIHSLGKGFLHNGCDVTLLAPMNFQSRDLEGSIEGVRTFWARTAKAEDVHSTVKRLGARIAFYKLFAREMRVGTDLVVLSNPNSDHIPAICLARRRRAFTVATYDDLRRLNTPARASDYITFAAGIVADRIVPRMVSANAAISTLLRARLADIAPGKHNFICPPIVDTGQFQVNMEARMLYRQRFGVEKEIVIGYLGTFWVIEGLKIMLAAIKELWTRWPGLKVIICGAAHRGLRCDDVQELVKEFGLSDIVVQMAWLPKEDVIGVMSGCDVLVVPKLAVRENCAGMPTKLAEYMSMAKAIVVSRVGDIPLYATDGRNCLICEPGNAIELASALYELVCDEGLRARLGREARLDAQKLFDYRNVSADFLSQSSNGMP